MQWGSPGRGIARTIVCCLLPAYMSMAAIDTVDWQDDVSWLRYWVVAAIINLLELVLPSRLSRLAPLTYLWCLIPGKYSGTKVLFELIFQLYELHHERLVQLIIWLSQMVTEGIINTHTFAVALIEFLQPMVWGFFFLAQSVRNLIILSLSLDPFPVLLFVFALFFLFWKSGTHRKTIKSRRKYVLTKEKESEEVGGVMAMAEKDNEAFTRQMKAKSKKIVMDAEHGEAKRAIERCKRFLNSVESSSFACKIFINSWEDIEGVKNFEKIVNNIGTQLRLPKEDIEGMKLCATGGKSKRDYLAFDCAMKEEGKVRLHTGGYSVCRKEGDLLDFQILHHSIDMAQVTLKELPDAETQLIRRNWFQINQGEPPSEGRDWNVYFQYEAHKNLLKELPEEDVEE